MRSLAIVWGASSSFWRPEAGKVMLAASQKESSVGLLQGCCTCTGAKLIA